ncbi:unnamed protein product [Polarella glacialis]|uniref:Uncharacterized protein n=1 Tax=Polarella glacialis TaxID=89957 RepID=A0A813H3X8_POLGL|nr:unnamed protein product [Polarella glacialis]
MVQVEIPRSVLFRLKVCLRVFARHPAVWSWRRLAWLRTRPSKARRLSAMGGSSYGSRGSSPGGASKRGLPQASGASDPSGTGALGPGSPASPMSDVPGSPSKGRRRDPLGDRTGRRDRTDGGDGTGIAGTSKTKAVLTVPSLEMRGGNLPPEKSSEPGTRNRQEKPNDHGRKRMMLSWMLPSKQKGELLFCSELRAAHGQAPDCQTRPKGERRRRRRPRGFEASEASAHHAKAASHQPCVDERAVRVARHRTVRRERKARKARPPGHRSIAPPLLPSRLPTLDVDLRLACGAFDLYLSTLVVLFGPIPTSTSILSGRGLLEGCPGRLSHILYRALLSPAGALEPGLRDRSLEASKFSLIRPSEPSAPEIRPTAAKSAPAAAAPLPIVAQVVPPPQAADLTEVAADLTEREQQELKAAVIEKLRRQIHGDAEDGEVLAEFVAVLVDQRKSSAEMITELVFLEEEARPFVDWLEKTKASILSRRQPPPPPAPRTDAVVKAPPPAAQPPVLPGPAAAPPRAQPSKPPIRSGAFLTPNAVTTSLEESAGKVSTGRGHEENPLSQGQAGVVITGRLVLQPNRDHGLGAAEGSPVVTNLSQEFGGFTGRELTATEKKLEEANHRKMELLGEMTKKLQVILARLSDKNLEDAAKERYQLLAQTIQNQMSALSRPAITGAGSKGGARGGAAPAADAEASAAAGGQAWPG